MSFVNLEIILFLFLFEIRCLSTKDKELIDKLKNSQALSKVAIFDKSCLTCNYDVFLYAETEYKILSRGFRLYESKNSLLRRISLKMDDEVRVNSFIEKLKESGDLNFKIRFFYDTNKEELIKFIKKFIKKVKKNKIEKVEVNYYCNLEFYSFYEDDMFYMELDDGNVTILKRKESSFGKIFLEKRTISSEYIKDLVSDNYRFYFNRIINKKKGLVKQYFLNEKLLLINTDSLEIEDNLLNDCSIEEKDLEAFQTEVKKLDDLPDMKHLNILFYFLKDSSILKEFVIHVLDKFKSRENFLFKQILKDFKIDLTDDHEPLTSKNSLTSSPKDLINNCVADDICEELRRVRVKDNINSYLKFLLYFYVYCKYEAKIEVDELLEIIKKSITENLLKKKNVKILQRLIKYFLFTIEDHGSSEYFIFDLFNEKKRVKLLELPDLNDLD